MEIRRREILVLALRLAPVISLTGCKGSGGPTRPTSPLPEGGGSVILPSPGPQRFEYKKDDIIRARISILTMPGPGSQLKVGSTPPIGVEYWQDLFEEAYFLVRISNDGIKLVSNDFSSSGEHNPFNQLGTPGSEPMGIGQTLAREIGLSSTFFPGISGKLTEIRFLAFMFGNKKEGVKWIGSGPGDCQPLDGLRTCNHWQFTAPTGGWEVK